MVTSAFLLRVLLSFLVGGVWIGLMTRVSERFGSKLGGLLVALPSTILVGLVFIGITQNQAAVMKATVVTPAAIAASSIFLVAFILLYRFGWLLAYIGAVALWFMLNLPLVLLKVDKIQVTILIAALLFTISLSFFHKQPHRSIAAKPMNNGELAFRIAFAGSFIALAVFLAKVLGPLWGGIFTGFPAAFSATLLLFAPKHGIDFTASVSRGIVHGTLANVVFVIAVYLLIPHLHIALGIALAYAICLVYALFSFRYIMPRV